MSIFTTAEQRAVHQQALATMGFDGPKPLGTDPFGAEYAVCVGSGSQVTVGCGCPVILGDPMPNPWPQLSDLTEVERGIYLHITWHQQNTNQKEQP